MEQSKLRAKFFKDDDNSQDYVEITIIGDPNTLIRKVKPEDVSRFPREWESYRAGTPEPIVGGTPLTEIPGVDKGLSLALKLKGVRNAEELCALDEAALKGLGMNMITFQKAAKNLVAAKRLEVLEALQAQNIEQAEKRGPGRPRKEAVDVPAA